MMTATSLFLLLFAAIYGGFLLLALSQKSHLARIAPGATPRAVLRPFGYGLLGLSLIIALWRDGPAFGAILWVIMLAVGGLAVVVTLTLHARWLTRLIFWIASRKRQS